MALWLEVKEISLGVLGICRIFDPCLSQTSHSRDDHSDRGGRDAGDELAAKAPDVSIERPNWGRTQYGRDQEGNYRAGP